jgi:TRAP-type C4-dicarboxylate transport system permease large subunit
VSKAVFPFFLIMVAFVVLLVAVPGMATYLPSVLF